MSAGQVLPEPMNVPMDGSIESLFGPFCNDEIPESPVDYVELPRRNAVGDLLDILAT
jgi:hypothetical protein